MSQQSQSQSLSTSAESRQEEAAAASVTKRENNWVDAEIRVQCRSIDELYEVNGLRYHGARRVRLSTSSLKQLGYCRGYCTCEPDLYKPEAF